jgi:hypothetical protein
MRRNRPVSPVKLSNNKNSRMSYALRTSDINSLIYQYLIERGLNHSAFLLKSEAEKIQVDIPPGQLVSFLEKALAMEELEKHRNEEVEAI